MYNQLVSLIKAYNRNAHVYHSHHLHLTFRNDVGERLYEEISKKNWMTKIRLPLGKHFSLATMFTKEKKQYLTTVVFSNMNQLLEALEIFFEYKLDDTAIIGWKLEGVVFEGAFKQAYPVDFCYIEYHRKFNEDIDPMIIYDSKFRTAVRTPNPLQSAEEWWSYSEKNKMYMTVQRVYDRHQLPWFQRNVSKFEVCYYEVWMEDYEKDWISAQTWRLL